MATRPHVYVLYTGGTIGCAGSPLAPLGAEQFADIVASQPGFSKKGGNTLTLEVNVSDEEDATIDATLDDMSPPIDSSSMHPSDWARIAQKLATNFVGSNYQGFVVLHGTDTMGWTSSALSYLLGPDLRRPVVVTGSQVPLSKTRNDALRNLVTSITLAATQPSLCEVTLFFDDKILRGNRAVKMSSSDFPAFDSPNLPPLGMAGIEIKMNPSVSMKKKKPPLSELNKASKLGKLHEELDVLRDAFRTFSVISIILYPGIQASTVRAMIQHTKPKVKGVILQAFGAGNAPADDDLIEALKEAHDSGTVVVDITQIAAGGVDLDAYASASGLRYAGAISGYELTPEAALAKLVYLIGKGGEQKDIEEKMKQPFNGDMSPHVKEEHDSLWTALKKRHGHPPRVRRLSKKRKAGDLEN